MYPATHRVAIRAGQMRSGAATRMPVGVPFAVTSLASCCSLPEASRVDESTTTVTVRIPTALLREARAITGEGVAWTVRQGLRQIVAVRAQERLRELRGRRPIAMDPKEVREDRNLDPY